MHEETVHHPIEHPERHEPTDIDSGPLVKTGVIFLFAGVIILLAVFAVLRHYERTATRADDNLTQIPGATPLPPEPRLQGVPGFHAPVPRADMEQLRRESEERLSTYGKSDDANFVRIPIDRAMQILAERNMNPTTQKSP